MLIFFVNLIYKLFKIFSNFYDYIIVESYMRVHILKITLEKMYQYFNFESCKYCPLTFRLSPLRYKNLATALSWIGLDWPGLGWTDLDWAGLTWTGLDWPGLTWTDLDWLELPQASQKGWPDVVLRTQQSL